MVLKIKVNSSFFKTLYKIHSVNSKIKDLEIDFDNSDSNSIPSIKSDNEQQQRNGLFFKRNDSSTPPTQQQQQHQQLQNDFKYSSTEQISSLSASSSNTSAGGCLITTNQSQQQQQQHYNTMPSSVNTINSSITLTNYIRSLNQQHQQQQQQSSTNNSTHTLINTTTSTKSDLNCGYISDGPHNKYSIHGSKSRKLTSNDPLDKSKPLMHRSLKNFFGK
jgi:hypothetical protein